MNFDYSTLISRILKEYDTVSHFAKDMGMSKHTLHTRLNNFTEFSQKEINRAAALLHIPMEELSTYFFTVKVQKTKHL